MQTREFFADSIENASIKLADSSSLSSLEESQSLKTLNKRIKTDDSPISARPWKKPKTIETKSVLSSSGLSSTSNSGVIHNAVNVSTDLCLVDKSWVFIKIEDHSVSCASSNLQSREALNILKLRNQTRRQIKQEIKSGISTNLSLSTDPWSIKKILTKSDLGHLSRLIISKELVDNHILRFSSEEFCNKAESKEGVSVRVFDQDTDSSYQLKFKRWVLSSRSYVLNGGWRKEFVKRRTLRKGDEIGICWDPYKLGFRFTVFQRAPPTPEI